MSGNKIIEENPSGKWFNLDHDREDFFLTGIDLYREIRYDETVTESRMATYVFV